jgi:HAD superfamily phosphatase (TIGR01668 family)
MIRLLTPKRIVDSIYDIDLEDLRGRGIEGILLDLDNTLVPWGSRDVPPEVRGWMDRVKAHRMRACIVSNDFSSRVSAIARILDVPAVAGAKKPATGALRRALQVLEVPPARAAIVGDQLFTDILAGNLLGLYTVLVTPLSPQEFLTTRAVRLMERIVMPWVRESAGRP